MKRLGFIIFVLLITAVGCKDDGTKPEPPFNEQILKEKFIGEWIELRFWFDPYGSNPYDTIYEATLNTVVFTNDSIFYNVYNESEKKLLEKWLKMGYQTITSDSILLFKYKDDNLCEYLPCWFFKDAFSSDLLGLIPPTTENKVKFFNTNADTILIEKFIPEFIAIYNIYPDNHHPIVLTRKK